MRPFAASDPAGELNIYWASKLGAAEEFARLAMCIEAVAVSEAAVEYSLLCKGGWCVLKISIPPRA